MYFRYLYIYYLPSGLFVVVSWVSFLIPPEVVPGRMALLVTLFLVLINIFNTITNVSPNTEGMTAIASWMIACMFFVFGALLAYATILYFLLVSSLFCLIIVDTGKGFFRSNVFGKVNIEVFANFHYFINILDVTVN